ncbi:MULTISPECIES: phosphopantetheine-binding protein [unclassified Lentimicrobium]|uniref:phosphopantetheine-binding protein n=1 Tax=unclassified Lentimicrobium TaxID=2677434 RepID=UPI0015576CB8|nr:MULTISPECIES: phosphopantetheine-binding protein [unclassified Lentimicrobium]NPD45305.1 acyl carrier protein [Lentimicrobium sp. S6]NPD84395.1 acyl carrier protein [Lentimicrobium sp. L6]
MEKNVIISKVNEFLIDEFEIEEEDLLPEATWKEMGIDSLDFVDIVVVVENVFGLVIKGEDMVGVKTLDQFYDFIHLRINS